MKPILALLVALAVGPVLHAQVDNQKEAFGRQVLALVRLAPSDFRDHRGPLAVEYSNSMTYTVDPLCLDLNTKEQDIGVPKDGTAPSYRAVYTGAAAVKYAQTALLGLSAIFSSQEPLLQQGRNEYEGFSVDAQMKKQASGILIASLNYNGVTVAVLNVTATGDKATLFIGIAFSENLAADKAKLSPLLAQSERVNAAGSLITVKGLGPRFDGVYEVGKLPPDGCVSGNCVDGQGRRVFASVTAAGPRLRILEGKFKNKLFQGDGVMLIEGEGPVLDGTYEVAKFKARKYWGLQAETTFHPKYNNGAVKGYLFGCYDYSVGSDKPEYRQYFYVKADHRYVNSEFIREDPDKATVVTAWERDFYVPVFVQRKEILENSPEMKAARARNAAEIEREYGPQNIPTKDLPLPAGSQAKGEPIKTTCFFCKGRKTIARTEYDYGEAYGKKYKVTRTVYDTCYKCKGTGKD